MWNFQAQGAGEFDEPSNFSLVLGQSACGMNWRGKVVVMGKRGTEGVLWREQGIYNSPFQVQICIVYSILYLEEKALTRLADHLDANYYVLMPFY